MRPRHRFLAALGAVTLAAAGGLAGATAVVSGDDHDASTCVAPSDAAGIDRILQEAESPLAGEGASFVRHAGAVGLDPRALVAIAKHESILATYAPAHRIKNPFGLGPHWEFASYERAIARASTVLGDGYLAEGRITLETIAPKWAPVGAANDPTGLNQHWTRGVGTYYAELGGDPHEPVLLQSQDPNPCGDAPESAPGESSGSSAAAEAVTGPPVVVAWGGSTPAATGPGPWDGADPADRRAASIDGFVFPLAAPRGAAIAYGNDYTEPGAPGCHDRAWRCAIDIDAGEGLPVVASIAGTLDVASAAEQEAGIGFWIVAGRDRVGYAPLASYAPDLAGGSTVSAGQHLGQHGGVLRFAWTRDGAHINPFALLQATRPSP